MQPVFDNDIVPPKRTAFDLTANLSFYLTAPPLLAVFLVGMLEWVFYCVFACEVIGFILGVVSLFGNRTRPASFTYALVGTFVGGIVGYVGYSIMRYGIGNLG